MSDQEAFLTRWSRRKRAAVDTAAEAQPAAPESESDRPANQTPGPSERDADRAPESSAPAEVDISALPPVESITAETDIRAFLASRVPAQLTRAALRRAWSADPAIRDFVGLAENAWDFTAPDGVPGFGPLLPGDEVGRLVGDALQPHAGEHVPTSSTPEESALNSQADEPTAPSAVADVKETQLSPAPDRPAAECDNLDAAVQKKAAVESKPTKIARGHGGALPQ